MTHMPVTILPVVLSYVHHVLFFNAHHFIVIHDGYFDENTEVSETVPHEKWQVWETAAAGNTHESLKLPVPSVSTNTLICLKLN
jgi:hypothetical protein